MFCMMGCPWKGLVPVRRVPCLLGNACRLLGVWKNVQCQRSWISEVHCAWLHRNIQCVFCISHPMLVASELGYLNSLPHAGHVYLYLDVAMHFFITGYLRQYSRQKASYMMILMYEIRTFWMQHSCRFPNARSVWHVIQMKGSWVVPDWNPDYGCRCLLCVADCQILGALFPYSPTSHPGLILPCETFHMGKPGYMFMDEITRVGCMKPVFFRRKSI